MDADARRSQGFNGSSGLNSVVSIQWRSHGCTSHRNPPLPSALIGIHRRLNRIVTAERLGQGLATARAGGLSTWE